MNGIVFDIGFIQNIGYPLPLVNQTHASTDVEGVGVGYLSPTPSPTPNATAHVISGFQWGRGSAAQCLRYIQGGFDS